MQLQDADAAHAIWHSTNRAKGWIEGTDPFLHALLAQFETRLTDLRVRSNDCYRTTHLSGASNTYIYQYNRNIKGPLHTWPSSRPLSCMQRLRKQESIGSGASDWRAGDLYHVQLHRDASTFLPTFTALPPPLNSMATSSGSFLRLSWSSRA